MDDSGRLSGRADAPCKAVQPLTYLVHGEHLDEAIGAATEDDFATEGGRADGADGSDMTLVRKARCDGRHKRLIRAHLSPLQLRKVHDAPHDDACLRAKEQSSLLEDPNGRCGD